LNGGLDDAASVWALRALNVAAQRGVRPTGSLQEIGRLLPTETTSSPKSTVTEALRLVGSWKLENLIPQLILFAQGTTGPGGLHQAAFDALREIGGNAAISALEPLTTKEQPPAVRRQAVLTLAALNLEKATRSAMELHATARIALTGTPVENRLGDLWSIYDFLDPGLLGSAREFSAFARRLAERPDETYAPLRRLIQPYLLRRLKTDRSVIADLPERRR